MGCQPEWNRTVMFRLLAFPAIDTTCITIHGIHSREIPANNNGYLYHYPSAIDKRYTLEYNQVNLIV